MKIKFVTLNIWKGGMFIDKIVSFIKKENPDILTMQEVRNSKDSRLEKQSRTMDVFKKELGYPYSVFVPAFLNVLPVGKIDEGNAIFSRFPIISDKVTFFDRRYGEFDSENSEHFELIPAILQHAVIKLNSLNLDVFNVHGIWGRNGIDNEKRLKMSRMIVDEVRDKENVILAGDFNLLPNTKTIQNIELYLKNVFTGELTTTFNMKQKTEEGYATSVVDMILISKNIRVIKHFCPKNNISDHLPLVCILELQK